MNVFYAHPLLYDRGKREIHPVRQVSRPEDHALLRRERAGRSDPDSRDVRKISAAAIDDLRNRVHDLPHRSFSRLTGQRLSPVAGQNVSFLVHETGTHIGPAEVNPDEKSAHGSFLSL